MNLIPFNYEVFVRWPSLKGSTPRLIIHSLKIYEIQHFTYIIAHLQS